MGEWNSTLPTSASHQAAREIAHTIAGSSNKVYLTADSLLLNLVRLNPNVKLCLSLS